MSVELILQKWQCIIFKASANTLWNWFSWTFLESAHLRRMENFHATFKPRNCPLNVYLSTLLESKLEYFHAKFQVWRIFCTKRTVYYHLNFRESLWNLIFMHLARMRESKELGVYSCLISSLYNLLYEKGSVTYLALCNSYLN